MTQITVTQAARLVGKDRSTIIRHITRDNIVGQLNNSKEYLVDKESLLAYYEAQEKEKEQSLPASNAKSNETTFEIDSSMVELVKEQGAMIETLTAQLDVSRETIDSLNKVVVSQQEQIDFKQLELSKQIDLLAATQKHLTQVQSERDLWVTSKRGLFGRLFRVG